MLIRKLIAVASSSVSSSRLSLMALPASLSLRSSSSSTTTTTKDNDNYDSLKDETLCQYSGLPALNQYVDDTTISPPPTATTTPSTIDSDDNLQGHWKSMESRVKRKSRHKGEGPDGRGTVRVTGWDAENV